MARVTNKKHRDYHIYGEKVGICDDWKLPAPQGFMNFIRDMGFSPSVSHSIDRKDGNLSYSKENCRWATKTTQAFNQKLSCVNKSGKSGVFWVDEDQTWWAYLNIGRKRVNLGRHKSYDDAVKVRKEAELKYYGEYKND